MYLPFSEHAIMAENVTLDFTRTLGNIGVAATVAQSAATPRPASTVHTPPPHCISRRISGGIALGDRASYTALCLLGRQRWASALFRWSWCASPTRTGRRLWYGCSSHTSNCAHGRRPRPSSRTCPRLLHRHMARTTVCKWHLTTARRLHMPRVGDT